MISIYFRPDSTQILQGSIRKDGKLHIEGYEETDAALPFITEDGAAAEANLQRFLHALKEDTDVSSDDVLAVLPDYLFSYIESIEYINKENLAVTIQEQTGETIDNLYLTQPLATESPAPDRQSVYAIKKVFVDRLVEASMKERIALISVEPASMAFYRAYGKWSEEMPLVEMFQEHASIITYSPAGGIFLSDAPTMNEKALLSEGAQSNASVSTAYAANDFAAGQAYANVNTDMPYIVLTDNQRILDIPSIRFRMPQEPVKFPDFVVSGAFPEEMEMLWMPCLGTLLQAYDEAPYKDKEKSPAYDALPPFIHVSSANLLPDLARQAARNRQWKRIIQRGSKAASMILGTAIVAELAAIFYFSTFHIAPNLQADYQKAKADLQTINVESDVIQQAKKENQQTFQALHSLTAARPDGCGFTELKIGSDNPEGEKDRSRLDYVTLTAIAGNEMVFQQFRENLAGETFFQSPSINSINADSNGFKTAKMTIARGGGKE